MSNLESEKVHTSELFKNEPDLIIESPYNLDNIKSDILEQDSEIDFESIALQLDSINNNMQTLVNISIFSMIGVWVVVGAICGAVLSIYFKF